MTEPGAQARVRLITRVGCHLCEPVRESVRRVCAQAGVDWSEVDVDSDPELTARYSDLVPVVLLDGKIHDYFRLDETRFAAALGSTTTSRWRRLFRGGD